MTILVTGATGLIGCHAVAELLSAGHAVRALVRDAEKLGRVLAPLGHACRDLAVIEGELNDRAGLMRALGGCTGLLHCAGRFSPDRADAPMLWETNVEGTRYVLEAGRSAGVERAVYVSSILALFPPAGPSLTAADPVTTPAEMYASTKAEAERAARAAQSEMPLTIVYPAAVQGPHDPTFSVGPQLVADALRNGRVLVTEGGLPSTDVRDLVTLIRCVFEGAATSTRLMAPSFFVRHDRYHTLLESLTGRRLGAQRLPGSVLRWMGRFGDLAQRFGRPVQLTSEAAAVLTRSVPVQDEEARGLLGRSAIDAERSFRDLIRWMVEAGHLEAADAGRVVTGEPEDGR